MPSFIITHNLVVSGYIMALLDFIELSDDEEIVDLSSDDETAEDSHNDFTCGSPGQHPTTMYDGQAVFVAEREGEATKSNAEEATPSSSVMEKGSLDTASSQNCPHTSTAVSFPGKFFSIPFLV
jgi:hypothetical protein